MSYVAIPKDQPACFRESDSTMLVILDLDCKDRNALFYFFWITRLVFEIFSAGGLKGSRFDETHCFLFTAALNSMEPSRGFFITNSLSGLFL